MQKNRLITFTTRLLEAAGADTEEASIIAKVLVWADTVGRTTQGVWRLPVITKRLKEKLHKSPCHFDLKMTTPTLGMVNAKTGLAHYVAHKVTEHAIETAKQEGICIMTINDSNHFGAGGYYTNMIAEAGMIGMALSNSFPKVIPHGGESPALGTNPFSFACPALNDAPLLVDMSTSEVAGSILRKAKEEGKIVSDSIFPFGGARGFSLSIVVEVLAGILSGAGISHQVKSIYDKGANNGHFILAIDIEKFMPLQLFCERMHFLISSLKASGESVQYPGENRWQALKRSNDSGVTLDQQTKDKLDELADEFNIDRI